MNQSVSADQAWRQIYETMDAYLAAEPWNVFRPDEAVGVHDVEAGRTGWVNVMGPDIGPGVMIHFARESFFAFCTDWEIVEEATEEDGEFMAAVQDGGHMFFGPKSGLMRDEKARLADFGLKYKRGQWPAVWRMRPGRRISQPVEADVRWLDTLLHQVIAAAEWVQANGRERLDEGALVTRRRDAAGGEWENVWEEIDEPLPDAFLGTVDELRLERLAREARPAQGGWLFDRFVFPAMVGERGDEHLTTAHLLVDYDSGLILSSTAAEEVLDPTPHRDEIMKVLENAEFWPEAFIVRNMRSLLVLEPIAERLDIELLSARELPPLEEAKAKLLSMKL